MLDKKAHTCTRRYNLLIFLFTVAFLLSACMQTEQAALPVVADYELEVEDVGAARKDLKVGVVPGPYGAMFEEAIYPFLREMGYSAELVYYDSFTRPNVALAAKWIDLNIFQHYRYLNSFKFEYDLSLSAIAEIPTVSMGVYSNRYDSIKNLTDGITISLPEDSTNFARALMVLENAGIIKLNPSIDKTKATKTDIVLNPYNAVFAPLGAHTLVGSLPDFDLSVINGNFALSGGLNISEALYNERLEADFFNVIAVRTEDLGEQFVLDIISVIRSDDYRTVILDKEGLFHDFQRPLNFYLDMD